MQSRFQIFACLATLVALFAGRDDADAAEQEVDSSNASTAVLYTDGSIIRWAEDDQNDHR